ncbi:hypothetical protein AYO44_07865 [Planctomycetaceae bacterium SCGC AG-212-F19]|nr:hypothetical protein AYO44_07865 [Planctomycetaceae bacterium SCGC AG-212-F19]
MKRHALLVVTVLTLSVTGGMFLTVNGSTSVPHRAAAYQQTQRPARPVNPCDDQAARRWLTAQPHHWRDCMLQQ